MPTAIAMPRLGMTMREGTVVDWRVRPGQSVARGETLLVIESEKAEVEIESPAVGFLRHIYVEEGGTVPCGTLLAALTPSADEPFDPEAFRAASGAVGAQAAAAPRPQAAPRAPSAAVAEPAAPPATPAARRSARELGIDLARVEGTGPGGRIVREDVEAFAERLESRIPVGDGISLEVKTVGEGTPVVLLPGFGTDLTAFARQMPVLADRYRVVAVNPRGVGVSDAPDQELYSVASAAEEAAALVKEGAHWIGASLGAAVALELAFRRPEAVRSLVLLTPFVKVTGRLLAVTEAWCLLAAEARAELAASALVPWLFSSGHLASPQRRQRTVRALAEIVPRISPAALRRWMAGLRDWSGSREHDLSRLTPPTLVVGAGEDLLTPGAEKLAEAIPKARGMVIPDTGHAVALEAAEAINEAILQHLSEYSPA
jgi:pimeloyl-ACP methyl ester carboxylesterase